MLKKTPRMPNSSHVKFYNRNGKIDDIVFNVWKSELQKELPSFWESMKK